MIPKKNRLSKQAEVVSTTARGRSFFSNSFIFKQLPDTKADQAKFTVIVSNKISKSAVVRNKLKRIIREAIRPHLDKMKFGKYAIIVKRPAVTVTSKDLSAEVKTALVKAKVL